jgi:hypothetical protein
VYDYLGHVDSSPSFRSSIYVDPGSRADHLWSDLTGLVNQYEPSSADVLFLAGMDWRALDAHPGIEERIPVFNLIQGIRHSVPHHELYTFLSKKATRICVSQGVAKAIVETGICNGPVFIIENGIDLSMLPEKPRQYGGVFIAGLKQPALALELADRLQRRSIPVECLVDPIPRQLFLQKISMAAVVVTLPDVIEGFYLPALEAMALGTPLVCPDCIGNRSFCLDRVTCLMPDFHPDSLERSVLELLGHPELASALRKAAFAQSRKHSIERERSEFLGILETILKK